jgi:hypothetical protein
VGAFINYENKLEEEVTKRIMSGNRAHFSHIQLFKSNILSKRTKIKLYKTLVRAVIMYGAETWTLKITDEQLLRVLERKIIRRICGTVCIEGNWRLRTNKEIDELIGHGDLASFVKYLRIR